jgi:hypothetical protein
MAAPVEQLCRNTDVICRDYAKLTKVEMVRRQLDIVQDTETITRLLDQLMNNTPASPQTTTFTKASPAL